MKADVRQSRLLQQQLHAPVGGIRCGRPLRAEQVREYPSCLRRPLSLLQQHRKAGRQGDRPCPRVGLGIACGKALALLPAHRAADFQGSIHCVEVLPPQAAQLAPPQAGGELCVEEVMP